MTKLQVEDKARRAVMKANNLLTEGGWISRIKLLSVFCYNGEHKIEIMHLQGGWGENQIYDIDEYTDIDELAEEMKEDSAFIEGDDDEWGDDDEF